MGKQRHDTGGYCSALAPGKMRSSGILARGLLYKEIADELAIATSTVRQHVHRIYEKLHVQNPNGGA